MKIQKHSRQYLRSTPVDSKESKSASRDSICNGDSPNISLANLFKLVTISPISDDCSAKSLALRQTNISYRSKHSSKKNHNATHKIKISSTKVAKINKQPNNAVLNDSALNASNVDIVRRQPSRRAAPTDLREPLLKYKMLHVFRDL